MRSSIGLLRSACSRAPLLARPGVTVSLRHAAAAAAANAGARAVPTTPPDAMAKLLAPVHAVDLSQERMLKPASAFTPLDDCFSVVLVGGHQVRRSPSLLVLVDE